MVPIRRRAIVQKRRIAVDLRRTRRRRGGVDDGFTTYGPTMSRACTRRQRAAS
jgi:hypothetical protein